MVQIKNLTNKSKNNLLKLLIMGLMIISISLSYNFNESKQENVAIDRKLETVFNNDIGSVPSTSLDYDPQNYDVAGTGKTINYLQQYDGIVDFDLISKDIYYGTQDGTWNENNLYNSDSTSDKTNYEWIETDDVEASSATQITAYSGDSTNIQGASTVATAIGSDDSSYVELVDGYTYVSTMSITLGNFGDTSSLLGNDCDHIIVEYECAMTTNIGALDNTDGFSIKMICDDGTSGTELITNNPNSGTWYHDAIPISSSSYSNVFNRVQNGGYIKTVQVFADCQEEILTTSRIKVDQISIVYYRNEYGMAAQYIGDIGDINFDNVEKLTIGTVTQESVPGTTVYVLNFNTEAFDVIGNTASTGSETITLSISENFDHWMNVYGEFAMILGSENVFNCDYDSSKRHLWLDQIYVEIVYFNSSTTTYQYGYNFTDSNPTYFADIHADQWKGLNPTNITIEKPELYEMVQISNSTDDDLSLKPVINGTSGSNNIVLNQFDSQYYSTGSIDLYFESENILNSSSFKMSKIIGYNYFEKEFDYLTVNQEDSLVFSISPHPLYASYTLNDLSWEIFNDEEVADSGIESIFLDEYEFYYIPDYDLYGYYNLSLQNSISVENDIIYVGFFQETNHIDVNEEIYISEDVQNGLNGLVYYDEISEKFSYSFSIDGATETTDLAIIHFNQTDPNSTNNGTLVKYDYSNIASDNVYLKSVYANTTRFYDINQNITFVFTFEYTGPNFETTVQINEISLVPRMLNGLSSDYYIYKNISIDDVYLQHDTPTNLSITINPDDLMDLGNIGVISNIFDIYIDFNDFGSENSSVNKLRDINICPIDFNADAEIHDIVYINESSDFVQIMEFDPIDGANGFWIYVANEDFGEGMGYYVPFGPKLPEYTYFVGENNITYDDVYYTNGNLELKVNASLLPEMDIMQYMYYSINDSNGVMVEDWIMVEYDYDTEDLSTRIFNTYVNFNLLSDGAYTISIRVIDGCLQYTEVQITVCLDRIAPNITPYGYPEYTWKNNSVLENFLFIQLNITEDNPCYDTMEYVLTDTWVYFEKGTFNSMEPIINIGNYNRMVGLWCNLTDKAGNNREFEFILVINRDGAPELFVELPSVHNAYTTLKTNIPAYFITIDENISAVEAGLYSNNNLIRNWTFYYIQSGEMCYFNIGDLEDGEYTLNVTSFDIWGSSTTQLTTFTSSGSSLPVEQGDNSFYFFKDDYLVLNISGTPSTSGMLSATRTLELEGMENFLEAFEISSTSNFEGPIKIRIYYDDLRVKNFEMNESNLGIWYYNEQEEEWEIVESTLNEDENYLEISVNHFSLYCIAPLPIEEPFKLGNWIWAIIGCVFGIGVVCVVNFSYKYSVIKEHKQEMKELRDKYTPSRTDSDVEEIENNNESSDELNETDFPEHTNKTPDFEIIDLNFKNIKPLDIPSRINFEIVKLMKEIQPFIKNYQQNEEMYNQSYVDDEAYKSNKEIISNLINTNIIPKYKQRADRLTLLRTNWDKQSYQQMELIVFFDKNTTLYVKKYKDAPDSEDVFIKYLSILHELKSTVSSEKIVKKTYNVDEKLHYFDVSELENGLYMAIICSVFPSKLYSENFDNLHNFCKTRTVQIREFPQSISKLLGEYINTPKILREIAIENGSKDLFKKCPLCGKLNPPNAEKCANDGVFLIF